MNRQLKFDIMLIVAIVVAALSVGYGARGIVSNKHNPPQVEKKPDINITIWVPDRDIGYSPSTLPGMPPKWKVRLKGKL